ncbi:MAG: hypothetical protein RL095_1727 [Verrucomicrobiota bacterium]|jgi:hypothetical protein
MKTRHLLALAVVTLLCGAAAWFSRPAPTSSGSLKSGDLLVACGSPVSIGLKGRHGELKFSLRNGVWEIDSRPGFGADQDLVAHSLELLKRLKVSRSLPDADGLAPYGLADKQPGVEPPVELTLKDAEGKVFHCRIGKRHKLESKDVGCYVLRQGDSSPVLVGDPLEMMIPLPQIWLRKVVPGVGELLSLSFSRGQAREWQASRRSGSEAFRFGFPAKLSKLDPQAAYDLCNQILQVRFVDVTAADGAVVPDPACAGEVFEVSDIEGRVIRLVAIRPEEGSMRCRLEVKPSLQLAEDTRGAELQERAVDWHFLVPLALWNAAKGIARIPGA